MNFILISLLKSGSYLHHLISSEEFLPDVANGERFQK